MMFVEGPFASTANDNDILFEAIESHQDLKDFLCIAANHGIVLVDRGFNHTSQVFEDANVSADYRIPGWTDDRGKFSARDIMIQYEITSARAVVEQAHAMWRLFRWFCREVSNTLMPPLVTSGRTPLKDYTKVGFVLSNFMFKPPRCHE